MAKLVNARHSRCRTVRHESSNLSVPTTRKEDMTQASTLVEKLKNYKNVDGCWLYQGSKNSSGYPQIQVDGKLQLLHRIVYERNYGVIPHGMTIDHACFHRNCINPAHLRCVTKAENSRRHERSQKEDYCRKCGMEKTTRPSGKRECPECHRKYVNEYARNHPRKRKRMLS